MDAGHQLLDDLRAGRLDAQRLIDLLGSMQRQLGATQQQLQATQQQLEAAQQRIAELEKQVAVPATAKCAEPFSVRAEEKRQQARQPKKKKKRSGRRGRRPTDDKLKQAERTENCFPEGVAEQDCRLSHTRPVWRLEAGRAVLVAYHIYRGPQKHYGQIPGVLGRSEFGLEIVVEIAYLVYVVGLSFDKVCGLLQFLQQVPLGKTQADRLLRQLSRHWQSEFDVLCTLLANSLVVHADETRWSINSVWAFLSEKARLLLFGVPKDAATLKQLLDPETFAGLMVSDDAGVYADFSQAQKCWAHLLRKAIKLTLQDVNHAAYRQFTDGLLDIYRQACRAQRDRRLGDAGRARRVAALEDALWALCAPHWDVEAPPLPAGPADDFRLLVNEVMRLALHDELFTFVTTAPAVQPNGQSAPVSGTNNEAERTLRGVAEARKTGRTSKTLVGARRQTILVSVLESLRVYLPTFTLASVTAEITSWWQAGQSCFRKLLNQMELPAPTASVLDQVLPLVNSS